MEILSLITHPHVIPNLQDLRSSSQTQIQIFLKESESSLALHRQQGYYHDQRTET